MWAALLTLERLGGNWEAWPLGPWEDSLGARGPERVRVGLASVPRAEFPGAQLMFPRAEFRATRKGYDI